MKRNEVLRKKNVISGILAGLIAGVVLGIMMLRMDMMMNHIGALMGMPNPVSGFAFHLIFNALFGLIFALVFYYLARDFFTSVLWGGIYGIIWWFLGTLTLGKLLVGAPVSWNSAAMEHCMPMLMAQIVWGVVLGICYHWFRHRR